LPALLDELVRFALKVTLRDGETTTQDVKIGGTPIMSRLQK
jgi:hypothetical protein